LSQDRTRLINRLKGLLVTQGLVLPIDADFPDQLKAARLWDGTPVPTGLADASPTTGRSCRASTAMCGR
jgi:hypothetical protein